MRAQGLSTREKEPADLQRIADILRKSNYQGFVVPEFEEPLAHKNIPAALQELRAAIS